MISPGNNEAVRDQWIQAARECLAPRLRTMREFAEEEIVLPSGPFEGRRFRINRQPFTGLWFDAVDSGHWSRLALTAPSQQGKTLIGSLIPLCYHLFEIGERVIFGLPDLDMAADKWNDEIRPIIERTRYRDLLPSKGSGSRGGKVRSITFRNGAKLRFMSAGGGDKSRSSYPSRVLIVTEVDGFDVTSATSREADKLKQLFARVRAFARHRIYLECTVSIEKGRIWQEYINGTKSRIVLPCPHCCEFVSPEREHLIGWRDAENEHEAKQQTQFACPSCGAPWSEEDRRTANEGCKLLHRGQSIDSAGCISGDSPPTDTLGFRWSAVNNFFVSAGQLGADEWNAARETNEDNAEREMRQFVWCIPYEPPSLETTPLDPLVIRGRFAKEYRKGFIPEDAKYFNVAVDPGKRVSWWIAVAWRPDASPHVVDYGRFDVASDDFGFERALQLALRDFRDDTILKGWALPGGQPRVPDRVTIDARYQGKDDAKVVYAFCRESGNRRFLPTLGCGEGKSYARRYRRPPKTGGSVVWIGEEYHVIHLPLDGVFVVEAHADYWKSWLHKRLATPLGQPGAATFFHSSDRNEHTSLAKHLTAEKQVEEFVPGKGIVVRWDRESRKNHWLDCFYNTCWSAHLCGARLIERPKEEQPRQTRQATGLRMPDGRPFLLTERS